MLTESADLINSIAYTLNYPARVFGIHISKKAFTDDKISLAFILFFSFFGMIITSFLALPLRIVSFALSRKVLRIEDYNANSFTGEKIKLLSWNIACAGGGFSLKTAGVCDPLEISHRTKTTRIEQIVEKVAGFSVDIACFQEASYDLASREQLIVQLNRKGFKYFAYCGGVGFHVFDRPGLLVASKFRLDAVSYISFPRKTFKGSAQWMRLGYLRWQVRNCTMAVTHLQPGKTPKIHTARENQFSFLSSSNAQVIVGDFNYTVPGNLFAGKQTTRTQDESIDGAILKNMPQAKGTVAISPQEIQHLSDHCPLLIENIQVKRSYAL